MINLKSGVDLNGLKPEMLMGVMIVASVYEQLGYDCIPTSVNDGEHSIGSLHYVGLAADFRIRHVPESDRETLHQVIRDALGEQFDAVLEPTHIHVEYQPKV